MNEITQGHARALLGLPDAESQSAACQRVIAEDLSVRQTEALVATGEPTPSRTRVRKDPAHEIVMPRPPISSSSSSDSIAISGTAVLIRPRNPDRGQIIIDYQTREELDRLAIAARKSRRSRRK